MAPYPVRPVPLARVSAVQTSALGTQWGPPRTTMARSGPGGMPQCVMLNSLLRKPQDLTCDMSDMSQLCQTSVCSNHISLYSGEPALARALDGLSQTSKSTASCRGPSRPASRQIPAGNRLYLLPEHDRAAHRGLGALLLPYSMCGML